MTSSAAAVLAPSAAAQSGHSTDRAALDAAVGVLQSKKREFARLGAGAKADLLASCIPRLVAQAAHWVAEGARAKGLPPGSGEEWLPGPHVTVRNMRLFVESLRAIERHGKPPLGTGVHVRPDGRVVVNQLPASVFDKVSFMGFEGHAVMAAGMSERDVRDRQAASWGKKDPEGKVALILGAGNVSSIPPMDAFTKWFVDGEVVLLKVNPVNEWVGPILEQIFAPFIERGFLRIVYGGGDVGAYLCEHAGIDTILITGSDKTYDAIVWGPPGPEREQRKAQNRPVNSRPVTAELGNVSPVVIVPARYSEDELWFQARYVVSMVANNGSFNCNAAKLLVTAKDWPQRERFLELVERGLAELPTRRAYYPGAADRWKLLVGDRKTVRKFGNPPEGHLPWAFIRGVDANDANDPVFSTEPFCALLSETSIGSSDPAEFLATVTPFLNDRVWGTLNAMLVIPPALENDPTVGRALDLAVDQLRYGTVGINHWPAVGYGTGTMAWGGHPSATPANIQSGLGWVHNTFMLDGIEKSVLRGPLVARPKPIWFYDFKKLPQLGPKLVDMEAKPSWLKMPGIMMRAM